MGLSKNKSINQSNNKSIKTEANEAAGWHLLLLRLFEGPLLNNVSVCSLYFQATANQHSRIPFPLEQWPRPPLFRVDVGLQPSPEPASQSVNQSVLGALVEAREGWQQFRKLTPPPSLPPPPPKQLSFYSKPASFTPRLAGNEDLTGVPPSMGSISLLFKLVCKDMKAGHDHGGLS